MFTLREKVRQSNAPTFHAETHLIRRRDGRAQTFAPLLWTNLFHPGFARWVVPRPRLRPHSNWAGGFTGEKRTSGRLYHVNRVFGVQEGKRVVAYGLHLGVSFYPMPCTGGSNRTLWMDGWIGSLGGLFVGSLHRRPSSCFFVEVIGHEDGAVYWQLG